MTTILLPLLYFPISFKCCRSTYPPLLSYHRTLGNVSRNYLLISLQSYKLVNNTGAHCSGCYSRSWIRTILAQACLKQIGTKLIIVTIVKRLKTRTWDCDCYCNQLYHNTQFTTIVDFLCDAVFHSTLKTKIHFDRGKQMTSRKEVDKSILDKFIWKAIFWTVIQDCA